MRSPLAAESVHLASFGVCSPDQLSPAIVNMRLQGHLVLLLLAGVAGKGESTILADSRMRVTQRIVLLSKRSLVAVTNRGSRVAFQVAAWG